MKKVLSIILALCFVLGCVPALAEEPLLTDGEFYYVIEGDCAVITGLIKGSDRYSVVGNQSGVEQRVINQSTLTVPYTIAGKRVELKEGAFRGENGFKKIVFEEGISYIPSYLCCDMYNLEEVILPESLVEIGESAFEKTKISKLDLKNVQKIGERAFYYCNLKELIIPDSVTEIGNAAFYCMDLETMYIGSGFNIESKLFFTSTKLSKIEVAEDSPYIKSVDDVVYDKSGERLIIYPAGKGATSFIIPEGVKVIDEFAMVHTNFESLTVPVSVMKFAESSINDIENVYYMGTRAEWDKIVIEDNNNNLKKAVIHFPDGEVKNIYENLRLCEEEESVFVIGLVDKTATDVTIPGEINSKPVYIQSTAFFNTDIVNVTLDESIKTIPYMAFAFCSNLENINLENVEHIGGRAFENCHSLKKVNLLNIQSWEGVPQERVKLDEMKVYKESKFYGENYETYSLFTPFMECVELEEVRIKWPEESSYEKFDVLFFNCPNLKKVTFENYTEKINDAEFYNISYSTSPKAHFEPTGKIKSRPDFTLYGYGDKVKEYAEKAGIKFEEDKKLKILRDLGVMVGYEDGSLRLENTLTRAEAATIIVRLLNKIDEAVQGETIFGDVPESHWASGYIRLATEEGIVNGFGNGIFAPEEKVTYRQMVKMLCCVLGYDLVAEARGGWEKEGYISIAEDIRLTKGVECEYNTAITRGDTAKLIYNALEIDMLDKDRFSVGADDGGIIETDDDQEKNIITVNFGYQVVIGTMETATSLKVTKTYNKNQGYYKKGDVITFEAIDNELVGKTVAAYIKKTENGENVILAVVERAGT